MKIFARTPQNCARIFGLLIYAFLLHLTLIIGAMFFVHILIYPALVAALFLIFVVGLLTHQVGYHPAVSFLLCAALLIPYAGVIVFLIIYFQSKSYLSDRGYLIGILGAESTAPQEDVTVQMDRLIQEGKIRIPGADDANPKA